MKELSLFTGMGGGIYGSMILGWETVAYVEKDKYCQKVIAQRIADKWFDNGEIHGDIAEFNRTDAEKYRGKIDILTGGFPCQPFSVAGKRKGTSDERYLFDEIIKTIKTIQPKRLLFENVPGILSSNAIIEIYTALSKIGYQCRPPLLLGSDDCGNIHRRKRVWIYATNASLQSCNVCECITPKHKKQCESKPRNNNQSLSHTDNRSERVQRIKPKKIQGQCGLQVRKNIRSIEDLSTRPGVPQPLFCGMDDELPTWRKQLQAIGNGQDPIAMATAYQLLSGERI